VATFSVHVHWRSSPLHLALTMNAFHVFLALKSVLHLAMSGK
jgi:hypothetical protein